MNRPLLCTFATLCLVFNSSFANAAITRYRFEPTEDPSFRYVSGDLPCQIAAQLAGQVSVFLDDDSGDAELRFLDVLIDSPFSETPEHTYCDPEYFEQFPMLSTHGGFDSTITGERITPTNFSFGPALSDDSQYRLEFTLTASSGSYVLSGSSVFNGDDGPSFFIDGVLAPVPEPPALIVSIVALTALSSIRSFRCLCDRSSSK
jgi:hypothetical protein